MKFFDKIKKHCASFFNQNNKISENIIRFEEKDLDNDGPTNIDIIDIHFLSDNEPGKINKEELNNMLKKMFSTNNISRLEKKKVLLDIYSDCLELHKALIPLVDLNIVYSIDIIGGAARDFLLDNHKKIKDLDILVSVSNNMRNTFHDYFNKTLTTEKILNKEWCTKEELSAVDFDDNDLLYKKQNKLLQLCLNRNHELSLTKIFSKDERKTGEDMYGEDILKELSGIIKVESPSLHYPMEILLTDYTRNAFLRNIDFGICTVGLKIVNLNREEYLDLVGFDKLAHHFVASIGFFEDVKNKTISYNAYNKSFEQIEFSFGNHLKRIEKKYPEYKLQIPQEYIAPETKKHIDTLMLKNNLIEDLEVKEEIKVKPKRNKI